MNNKLDTFFEEVEKHFNEELSSGNLFNIFNELAITTDEVKHSLILKSIIDPNGLHGHSHEFYKEFLSEIGLLDEEWLLDFSFVKIHSEYFIGNRDHKNGTFEEIENYGRIDLLIENSKANKGIIIENKIHAKDQPLQLIRYNEFGESKYGKGNFKILYLTLDGKNASKISTNDIVIVKNISYCNDILNFLKRINRIENNKIKSIISQYINVLESLTNKSKGDEIKENKIFKNYNIDYDGEIINYRDEMRVEFLKEMERQLINQFKISENKTIELKFVQKIHNEISIDKLVNGKHLKNLGFRISENGTNFFHVEIQDYSKLIYGVFYPEAKSELSLKMVNRGYEFKPFWLRKEYKISNTSNISFNFYSDYLNYTFKTKKENIAKDFAQIIYEDYTQIFNNN